METNGPAPDRHEAAARLEDTSAARRAVRDRPWPFWLYPTNALLLGGLALSGILDSSILSVLVVLVLAVSLVALNNWAGRRIGTPFAIPTSRGFCLLAALSALFVLLSLPAGTHGSDGLTLLAAAGAVLSYGFGSVLHYRSTHR